MLPARRSVIKAMSLFGLGRPDPSRFPYPGRPQPSPGIGPSQGTILRARQVIIIGADGDLLVYSATPARGNLVFSISGQPTVDSKGNLVNQGAFTYSFDSNGDSAGFISGRLAFLNSSGQGIYAALDLAGNLTWFPAAGTPVFDVSGLGFNADDATFVGQVTATGGTESDPTLITTDTAAGNSLGALAAGSGYAVNTGRYWLDNNGFTVLDVNLTAGAATVAGTYAFANSLPAALRPLNAYSYPMGYNGTNAGAGNWPSMRVSTAGVVELQIPALPANTVLCCTQLMPVT